ncbi:hypothetical protein GCM10018954_075720 [Kutzneria kofuensis]
MDLGMPDRRTVHSGLPVADVLGRWCKHCTHAACLDVCPTGALFRTEYGTVVVQEMCATVAATACRRARSA